MRDRFARFRENRSAVAGHSTSGKRALAESLEQRSYLSAATLAFSDAIPLPIANHGVPTQAVAGDFNSDGRPDLAVVDNQGIQLYLNQGDGSFKTGSTVLLPAGATVADLTAVDIGNGHVDLAFLDTTRDSVDILLGNGDGSFGGTDTYPVGDVGTAVNGVINTGGLMVIPDGSAPDLAVGGVEDATTHQSASELVVLHNDGTGAFSIGKVISLSPGNSGSGIYTSTNLVLPSTTGTTVLVGEDAPDDSAGQPYITTLAGTSPNFSVVHQDIELGAPGGSVHYQIVSAVGGDFNGDGVGDFAAVLSPIGTSGTSYLSILLGTGGGNFQTPMVTALPSMSVAPTLVAGNFRGTGSDDLVIGNQLFENSNGAGAFTDLGTIANLQQGFNDSVATYDGESLPDFIGTGSAGGASVGISLYLNSSGKTATTTRLVDSTGSKKTANPSVKVTFSAIVSGPTTAGGDVAFYAEDAIKLTNSLLGFAPLLANGTASLVTNALNEPNGTYQIQAAFLGTSAYAASPSNFYTFKTFRGGGNGKSPGGGTGIPGAATAAITGKILATVIAGQKTKIGGSVSVGAVGGTVSGAIGEVLYLSSGTTIDSNSIKLLTASKKVNLPSGAKTAIPIALGGLPSSVTPAAYYLIAQITDPSGRAVDAVSTSKITVAAPQIDLSGAFSKQPIVKGSKATLTFNVSNAGNIPAVGPLLFDIETSPKGQAAGATIVTGITKKISIKPNSRGTITVNASLPPGTYFIAIDLDPNNAFKDTNLSNNFFAASAAVTIS